VAGIWIIIEYNELSRRKQRGINKENIFNIAASGGEYNPERLKQYAFCRYERAIGTPILKPRDPDKKLQSFDQCQQLHSGWPRSMKLVLTITHYKNLPSPQPLSKIFDQMGGTIGRAPNNDMVLADPAKCLSRQHAKILYQAGNYYLVDAGKKNPIYINNCPLGVGDTAKLANGDVITICDYNLAVSLSSLEQPTGVSNSFDVLNVQSPPHQGRENYMRAPFAKG
jgi:hypothetical protein